MQHKGEIVEKAVRESGIPISKVAKTLGKNRRWMYHTFKSNNISIDVILEIGKIIHHDFSKDIKGLIKYKLASDQSDEDMENKAEFWKNKYVELLEKYNELLITYNKAPEQNTKKK
ncbi:MAG: hypothetical protein IPM95_14270 [Sphingobacteriales bacterium]|nr:hypothetical protein [Sphingobacteriales bacterium]